jgi:hypothetical protein
MFASQKWELSAKGIMAQTWISNSLVLQRRSSSELDCWRSIIQVTANFPQHPLFKGSRYQLFEVEDSCFWLLSDRIDDPQKDPWPDFHRPANVEVALKIFGQAFNDLLETSKLLWSQPTANLPLDIYRDRNNTLSHAHWSSSYVKFVLKEGMSLPLLDIPDEPVTERALSHGDALLKNIVLSTDNRYCLIDWEGLSVQEKHADITRNCVWVLFYLEPSQWVPKLEPYLLPASNLLDISRQDLLRSIGWAGLRDIAAWSRLDHRFPECTAQSRFEGCLNLFEAAG